MRFIINCDADLYDAACILLSTEMRDWERRYNKVGLGWTFPLGDARCFIRRVKHGLSLAQIQKSRPLGSSERQRAEGKEARDEP